MRWSDLRFKFERIERVLTDENLDRSEDQERKSDERDEKKTRQMT